MPSHFHVTSALNRVSITRFGLDWRRMGAAPGIAGSHRPEQQGCFLALNDFEVEWFVRMNNTGGPVDVWEVHGIEADDLVLSPEGLHYFPGTIAAAQLRLVRRDVPPART
ncbi:hypothetical protein [Nocardia suismassiliense]|uniref:hypothetical protein n=1 Tax=Nocardia suismassiliense TaxID=2077092 RepID=UPI000D1DC213|nr:hypothetical protein [Nocardia suismassiliense]